MQCPSRFAARVPREHNENKVLAKMESRAMIAISFGRQPLVGMAGLPDEAMELEVIAWR